ncbi:MAG: hypothetical protein V8S54_02210 [Lachnospiraceae bacterium]
MEKQTVKKETYRRKQTVDVYCALWNFFIFVLLYRLFIRYISLFKKLIGGQVL